MTLIHGRSHQPLFGGFLAFIAISIFAVQDVLIKSLALEFHLFQIMFIRSVTIVIPVGLYLWWKKGLNGFKTCRKKDHFLRVCYNLAAFLSYYFALTRLPLADATAIALSQPLFLTLLSGPLLGEPADLKRKLIVVFGFIGVLIVVNPTFHQTDWVGAGCATFGALMFAMLGIQTRKISATEDTELMIFYGASLFLMSTAISLPFVWTPPIALDTPLLVSVGLVAMCAQYCIVHSLKFAAVYVIAPIEYVILLWALLFGWLFFSEMPTSVMLGGCIIIVSSGLGLAMLEKRERR